VREFGTLSFVTSPPTTLRPPPGRQRLSRDFIAQHQRARIIAALAHEVAAKGYRAVTVADVVRGAGIARNTFYDNFSSKEDCFLAAQKFAVSEALERVIGAAGDLNSWPEQIEAGLRAFLAYADEEPDLARTCMVEALSAGPRALSRYEESVQVFISLFRTGRNVSSQGEELPDTLEEAIVGGIFWLIYQRLIEGGEEGLEGLLPEILEFARAPYLGTSSAHKKLAR
jgi:AcrR family transcriptional regulator